MMGTDATGGTEGETASGGEAETASGAETANETERSGLSRTVWIAVGLAIAVHPLFAIADAIVVTTGYEALREGLWLGIVACAALFGYRTDHSLDSFGLFTAVTLLCWYVIAWTTGVSAQRLEYAPSTLLGEALALLAAVCVGIAVAFGDELTATGADDESDDDPTRR